MINKTEIASKFVKQYLNRDGTSKHSIRKLSSILHTKHPDLYKDSEDSRWHIKKLIGSLGQPNRANAILDKHKIEWKGVKLPKPEKNDYSKVIINQKRLLVLSDIHFPYYNEEALNAAIDYGIKFKPDCVILLGDIIDCYHLSSFEKDKRNRSFKYELDMLAAFFVELRELFTKQRIIYVLGNHERRYQRQILANVPELLELELFNFQNVVQAKKYGVEVVDNKRILKAGHLNLAHGDEFKGGIIAPVNPARGYFLKAKTNIICGHNHRTSSHIERDLSGKIIGGWSIGCLSDLYPQYAPINSYNHGFATVEIVGERFNVNNITIIDGKII